MDWTSCASELAGELESFARRAVENHPDEHVYCVAIWLFYSDRTVFYPPIFSAATREWLDAQSAAEQEILRWAAPDYPIQQEEFDDSTPEWYRRLGEWITVQARAADGDDGWDAVVDRFVAVVVDSARLVSTRLRAEALVEDDFVVTPLDGDWDPELRLVAQILTQDQLRAHPDLAAMIGR